MKHILIGNQYACSRSIWIEPSCIEIILEPGELCAIYFEDYPTEVPMSLELSESNLMIDIPILSVEVAGKVVFPK